MLYISVELIALLEAVVYNFSQGMSERQMKFQFFFAVFLAISKKLARLMYVQAYVSCKNTLFCI